MKSLFISDITDGQNVNDMFMVQEVSKLETKAGKPYLSLKLMDKSGEIAAKVWDHAEQREPECPPGAVIAIKARCSSYRNALQLSINDLRRVPDDEVDFSAFVPSSKNDIDEMATEFLELVVSVDDSFIKKLLIAFFGDAELFALFKKAPAAKAMHHAYLGGLLEHTLHVCRLADNISTLYPSIDRSLLMAGAMLHDIGKIGIPLSILDKPGCLTDDEYETIKDHPSIGAKILEPIHAYAEAVPIVHQHHETSAAQHQENVDDKITNGQIDDLRFDRTLIQMDRLRVEGDINVEYDGLILQGGLYIARSENHDNGQPLNSVGPPQVRILASV